MDKGEEIKETRYGIIDAMGRSAEVYGVNYTIGRIFALLYMADEPMGLDEMADELSVSKATISINIRILHSLKAVNKVRKRGSRKDYYESERDFNKIAQEIMRNQAMAELRIQKEAISEAITAYTDIINNSDDQEMIKQAKIDLEKIIKLGEWIQVGEKWLHFFMDTDLHEGPEEEVQRIQVEWED